MELLSRVEPKVSAAKGLYKRIQDFRHRHATAELLLVFMAGFISDYWTLGRIDDRPMLFQQGLFLVGLIVLLVLHQRQHMKNDFPRWFAWIVDHSEIAIHFFLGGLLSLVTLFYLKSASGITSGCFVLAIFGLLFANETERFHELGPVVRFSLMAFCMASYLAYLLPVLLGFMSPILFLASVGLSGGVMFGLYFLMVKWGLDRDGVRRTLLPSGVVLALLVTLYVVRVIPPVPLSVRSIAMYHGVDKEGPSYRLSRERSGWKFWQRGDQTFVARQGDRVYCFVKIFAPSNFHDVVKIRWSFDDPKLGWRSSDAIPLSIAGGREEGYRGFAFKANYQPGDWRVEVETDNGRNIGAISFSIEQDSSTDARVYKFEQG